MSEHSSLRQLFGEAVELNDDEGSAQTYRILAELSYNENRYAILQSEANLEDDTFEVFRVVEEAAGELQLESVTDEEEWESVAEVFDDSQFGNDDRP